MLLAFCHKNKNNFPQSTQGLRLGSTMQCFFKEADTGKKARKHRSHDLCTPSSPAPPQVNPPPITALPTHPKPQTPHPKP